MRASPDDPAAVSSLDTTIGDPMPMGERHAVAADTVAEPPDSGNR
jgi:hypothetical protein